MFRCVLSLSLLLKIFFAVSAVCGERAKQRMFFFLSDDPW